MLYGKRLALVSDTDKYGGAVNVLKRATGEDLLPLEIKNQQQRRGFVFGGLVVMASNEALKTSDHTSGLERRRVTIRLDRVITNREKRDWEQRGGEVAILHREIPGLVHWVLDLSEESIREIIDNPPKAVVSANFEAAKDENPVIEWIEQNCIPDSTAWTQIGVKRALTEYGGTRYQNAAEWLYPNYLTWCMENGRTPLSIRVFSGNAVDVMRSTFGLDVFKKRENPGEGIQGLRFRHAKESMFDWVGAYCRKNAV